MIDVLTPILPSHIDSTMMSCFRSCPRKFYNEFVLGLRPPGISIDLHAGGCFATALEVVRKEIHMNGRSLSEALLRANAAFEIQWGDFVIPESKKTNKTPDRVWAAVEDYFRIYPPLTDHIQPYMVNGKPTFEFTFAIPLEPACMVLPSDPVTNAHNFKLGYFPLHPVTGEPFLYVGRFDQLGEYLGRPIVEDDKTAGTSAGFGWAEKWDLRSQFIGYTWACQQMGIDVEDVCVRGVGILMTKIDHAEVIKPYSNHLRDLWLEQLRRDLWRLVSMWNEVYFDYNFGDACSAFSNCMFTQPCQSPDPEPWLKTFVVRRWNPVAVDPTSDETKPPLPSSSTPPETTGSNSPSSTDIPTPASDGITSINDLI